MDGAGKKVFPLGKVMITMNVGLLMERDSDFNKDVWNSMRKFAECVWKDISDEQREANLAALQSKTGKVVASYSTWYGEIYLVREFSPRLHTTILFADEYAEYYGEEEEEGGRGNGSL